MRLRRLNGVFAAAFLVILSGCSESPQDPDFLCNTMKVGPQSVPGFDLKMSDQTTCKQRTSVESALSLINSRALYVSDPVLQQALGGMNTADIRDYLNARVKFIGGEDLMQEARRAKVSPMAAAGVTNAVNIGIQLWLESMGSYQNSGRVTLDGKDFEVTSGRVGIIALGAGFNLEGRSDFNRLLTLLHEARHSDCTSGLDEDDILLITQGRYTQLQSKNPSCGHLHSYCPPGHELEGVPACDSHAWGAYSMGWIFAQNFLDHCTGCDEKEIQSLSVAALDSKSRLLNAKLNNEQGLDLSDHPELKVKPVQK